MKEEITLYSATGQEIRTARIDWVRPRFRVLLDDRRTWVWDDDADQYRETSAYYIPMPLPQRDT